MLIDYLLAAVAILVAVTAWLTGIWPLSFVAVALIVLALVRQHRRLRR